MAQPDGQQRVPAKDGHFRNGAARLDSDVDAESVRRQLSDILQSPAFRNSKRYSAFLQYVVDRTLSARDDELKERTIGVEVFGRLPDFDTSTDHIVRSGASEVRKRLAQYYATPDHAGQLRIELLAGSYVPEFRPATEVSYEAGAAGNGDGRVVWGRTGWRRWLAVLTVVSACVVAAVALTRVAAVRTETALDRFWGPVVAESKLVLLCPGSSIIQDSAPATSTRGFVSLQDATVLAELAALFRSKGNEFQVHFQQATTFDDLRENTGVLVGAVGNVWMSRFVSSLRFRFDVDGARPGRAILDSQNAGRNWVAKLTSQQGQATGVDYAIVARFKAPDLGRNIVVISGASAPGTAAAGEFVTVAEHMAKLEERAPSGWQNGNLEIVISTNVVNGTTGPPKIEAVHFW